jgi:hypothetical protein
VQRAFAFLLLVALVALACLSAARRIERERRLISRLREREAMTADRAVPVGAFSADEQDTLRDLIAIGIVRAHELPGGRRAAGARARRGCYLDRDALVGLRYKRTRLALSGILALAAAVVVLVLALHA